MQNEKMRLALLSGLVGAALVAGGQSLAQHEGHGTASAQGSRHNMAGMQAGAKMLHEEMMRSAKKTIGGKMPMHNDTDRAFNLMMAEHHATGVRMAEIEIKHGNDAASKQLARKIMADQKKERSQLLSLAQKAK